MRVIGYRTDNRWVVRPIDLSWRRWLLRSTLGALALAAVLAAFIGPRQTLLRTRYRIAQLTLEAERLQVEQRRLLLEKERLTSPAALARELPDLGLEPVKPEQAVYFTASGALLERPALPTPAPAAAKAAARPPRKGR